MPLFCILITIGMLPGISVMANKTINALKNWRKLKSDNKLIVFSSHISEIWWGV
jgi:ABC-type Na+ transport system ATPase subunit NatA